MIKYLIMLLLLVSCVKEEEGKIVYPDYPPQVEDWTLYEWDDSECVTKSHTPSTNRVVVFGSSISNQSDGFGYKLSQRLGRDFVNLAQTESTASCHLNNIRNADLKAGDIIIYIAGETELRLGMESWELYASLKKVRSALDAVEGTTIIIGTTMKMQSSQYGNHPPFDQGSTAEAHKYRSAIMGMFDTQRYQVVDTNALWVADASYYSTNNIQLNDTGNTELADIIYNNVNWD